MSHKIPDEEFRAIKASWRAAPASEPPLTNAAAVEMCHVNIREAHQRERRLRELYQSLMPGDARLLGGEEESPLWLQIHTAVGDQKHWNEYLRYYQDRAAREGRGAVVPVPGLGRAQPGRAPASARPIAPDPRLPRERTVGEDDDEGVF